MISYARVGTIRKERGPQAFATSRVVEITDMIAGSRFIPPVSIEALSRAGAARHSACDVQRPNQSRDWGVSDPSCDSVEQGATATRRT